MKPIYLICWQGTAKERNQFFSRLIWTAILMLSHGLLRNIRPWSNSLQYSAGYWMEERQSLLDWRVQIKSMIYNKGRCAKARRGGILKTVKLLQTAFHSSVLREAGFGYYFYSFPLRFLDWCLLQFESCSKFPFVNYGGRVESLLSRAVMLERIFWSMSFFVSVGVIKTGSQRLWNSVLLWSSNFYVKFGSCFQCNLDPMIVAQIL